MDSFFWTTVLADSIHALISVGAGFFAAWFLVSWFLRKKAQLAKSLTIKDTGEQPEPKKQALPLRLQACERLVLFLERIRPASLLLRVQKPGMSSQELQLQLMLALREEFEYNLSQQIYVSNAVWEMVKNVKEDLISMVNMAASKTAAGENSVDLARKLLEISLDKENETLESALKYIKDEARQLMR